MRTLTNIITPRPAVPLEPGSCLALKCAHGHAYVCTCTRYDYCAHLSHLPDPIFLEPTCHCGHTRHDHTGALTEGPMVDCCDGEPHPAHTPDDADTVEQIGVEHAAATAYISERLNHDDAD